MPLHWLTTVRWLKSQWSTVHRSASPSTCTAVAIDAINTCFWYQRNKQQYWQTGAGTGQQQNHSCLTHPHTCGWCGKAQYSCELCPARNVKYHQWGKPGNYAAVCCWTNLDAATHVNTVQVEAFLGTCMIDSGPCWTKRVFISDVPVQMKLDMGVDINAIPETVYLLNSMYFTNTQPTRLGSSRTWWKTDSHLW